MQSVLLPLFQERGRGKDRFFLQPPPAFAVCSDGRAAKGKKLHMAINSWCEHGGMSIAHTGPVNFCTNSPEMSFPYMFLAGKILKESMDSRFHSPPLPMVLLRSPANPQVMWDWAKLVSSKTFRFPIPRVGAYLLDPLLTRAERDIVGCGKL